MKHADRRLPIVLAGTWLNRVIQRCPAFNQPAHGNKKTCYEGGESDGCGTHQLLTHKLSYKLPLRDVVGLQSGGCRKTKRGEGS